MLIDTIKKENMLALKSKDENKRAVYGIVITKYMNLGYEMKAKGEVIGDAELLKIISKTVKELEEEKASYENAGREESAKNIAIQISAISDYLPKLMSEEEIKAEILKLEDRSIPVVMKHFKVNFAGKCDMALVNKVLKSL